MFFTNLKFILISLSDVLYLIVLGSSPTLLLIFLALIRKELIDLWTYENLKNMVELKIQIKKFDQLFFKTSKNYVSKTHLT